VLEAHVTRLAGPAWGMPAAKVPLASAAVLVSSAGRDDGERWSQKLGRTRRAFAHAFVAKSKHEAELGRRQG
jgi:hypothetical protein